MNLFKGRSSSKLRLKLVASAMALAIGACGGGASGPDLFMRDTASDTGAEPYAGPGPIYLSPDIWVRNDPDPQFDPYPFPTGSPTWTPAPHQNPEYRDPKNGVPNYVYVRIHNRGAEPSTGTERLRLYQAKAGTGLAWDTNWVDHVAPACGADRLYGIEITKPRKNAKLASQDERDAYRDALLAIQTDPQYQYSDGVQYWRKQNSIHATAGNPEHGNPAFLPWHREMMNHYEALLREADPLVTLLYWDWTEDPRAGPVNLFSTGPNGFMGEGNGTVDQPLTPLRPPTLLRNVGGGTTTFSPDSDATLLASGSYPTLRTNIERSPNHDSSHGYIGGGVGQIRSLSTAAQDPFFFLLHGNVDRLWANWQRDNADVSRIDTVSAYGSNSSHSAITGTFSPWDGATTAPWTSAPYPKTGKDESIVYPPVYDTAPLRIPVLQPGESVVIEIPWYPPNVNNFNCFGDAGHFCLLARIETSDAAPYGMTTAEIADVGYNTVENNNIAWKNLTIVDAVAEPSLRSFRFVTGTTLRNVLDREAVFIVRLAGFGGDQRMLSPRGARTVINLPAALRDRIAEVANEKNWLGVEWGDAISERASLIVTGERPQFPILLKPGETVPLELEIEAPEKLVRGMGDTPVTFNIEQVIEDAEVLNREEWASPVIGGVGFVLQPVDSVKLNEAGDRGVSLDIQLADNRSSMRLKAIEGQRAQIDHLSPGEPVSVAVRDARERATPAGLELQIDGAVAAKSADRQILEEVRFDKPGVHVISVVDAARDGRETLVSRRVLVSEDIPPILEIGSPKDGGHYTVGQTVEVRAAVEPAYTREIKSVTLHVKKGDLIEDGLDLVRGENYPAVDESSEPPYALSFTPQEPGMYMLQIGAVDDAGNIGVSSHVDIMVMEQ